MGGEALRRRPKSYEGPKMEVSEGRLIAYNYRGHLYISKR